MRVEAKICGITRVRDAELAAANGAWRLGVVFAGGPRVVTAAGAREIVAAAGGVPVLGVFGSQPLGTMLQVSGSAGLAGVQLHGHHGADVAHQLRQAGLEVWRVVAIAPGIELDTVVAAGAQHADAVLLEPRVPGGGGGKGVAIPLELARAARLAAPATRIVLAGGLTADNVTEAIRVVRPDAVDVSSGIESSPGRKDRDRLVRFLENVIAARLAD